MKHVFVVGLDPFHLALLRTIRGAREFEFHSLGDYPDITDPPEESAPFETMLAGARRQLDAHRGSVDGIIGYWDFPTTGIVPLLRREYGLPAPTLEAVASCEHKYWSRLRQVEVVPGLVPRFQVLDPFATDPAAALELPFPFWIKPVKAHSSFLGFRIHNYRELRTAIAQIRQHIGHIATMFDEFLAHVDLPADVAGIGGHHCIVEEIISRGHQCTLEGFVFDGKAEVYGTVDSIRSGRHRSCFSRYQYPSALPRRIRSRMADAAARVMQHIGYDHAAFNAEFYWHPRDDSIRLLEINTRISKSHSPLFLMVDGASNQQVAVELTLGRQPTMPVREGAHRLAAKFMLRAHEDAMVEHAPDIDDIRALQSRYPEARVRVLAPSGTRLAHLSFQDSYSFELGELFLGAGSQKQLLAKEREAERILGFRVRELEGVAA